MAEMIVRTARHSELSTAISCNVVRNLASCKTTHQLCKVVQRQHCAERLTTTRLCSPEYFFHAKSAVGLACPHTFWTAKHQATTLKEGSFIVMSLKANCPAKKLTMAQQASLTDWPR